MAKVQVPPMPILDAEITRHDFPKDFVFGCATSSYQVEGAYATDGRTFSIWDVYTNAHPANIGDGSNGNQAVDMYHRYKDDIRSMKNMGFDAYRFSISWSRILPGGRPSLGVNQLGLDYYNDLINTIIENGMKPYVTLFHWDLPYLLEKEYGGFLSTEIIEDFRMFAELCFWEFGDRVKHWITINEAWSYASHGYAGRTFPPGNGFWGSPEAEQRSARSAQQARQRAQEELENIARGDVSHITDPGTYFVPYRGDRVLAETTYEYQGRTVVLRILEDPPEDPARAKEAYTVGRNILLSHAAAVKTYRERYQAHQNGLIGMTNCVQWLEPFRDTDEDRKAARRGFDFMLGWFLEPVLTGQYPQNMIDFVPPVRLELFTEKESELLRGSCDFLGINYYTTAWAANDPNPDAPEGYNRDQRIRLHTVRDGVQIGESPGSSWLYIVPWGFNKMLKFINDTFNTKNDLPPIYITENGCDQRDDPLQSAHDACRDDHRVGYFRDHLSYLLKTIKEDNVKIESYFAWSYCDNFEWSDGYRSRFGMTYIDFKDDLKRIPKDSAVVQKVLAPVAARCREENGQQKISSRNACVLMK